MIDFLRYTDKYATGSIVFLLGLFKSKKNLSSNPKSILVIKLWAIGDSVNSLPFIKFIKDKTGAKITVAVRSVNHSVFKNQKFIDEIMLFEPKNFFKLLFSKKYDLVFDLEPYLNVSAIMANWLGYVSIGFSGQFRSRLYDYGTPFYKDRHIVHTYMKMLDAIGVKSILPDKLIPLIVDKSIEKSVNEKINAIGLKNKNIIAFCASVGYSIKEREWPANNFRELTRKLLENKDIQKKYVIALVGEKPDFELNESIKNGNPKIINLSGVFSKEELYYFTTKCIMFISNDTGPMHIAAAQRVKTIGLFGPNTPKIWSPYGTNKNGTNNLSIFHPAKGCPFLDNTSHELKPAMLTYEQKNCMEKISVKEVYDAALKLLKGRK